MRTDCKHEICPHCGKDKKPLFNVTLYCPNECDRKFDSSVKWYSYYHVVPSDLIVHSEVYLTMSLDVAKKKVEGTTAMVWEVALMEGANISKLAGEVYQGGPVRLVKEIKR